MKKTILCAFGAMVFHSTYSQTIRDSVIKMPPVEVNATSIKGSIARLPEIYGTNIYSGKKNEVILLDSLSADIAQNRARDVFAKVPGIASWELDGSGTQVSVGTRGLSPHRSWEFNVNQNGYNVNNDLYGYPEAMYNPPLEGFKHPIGDGGWSGWTPYAFSTHGGYFLGKLFEGRTELVRGIILEEKPNDMC